MLPREQGGVVDANLRVYGLANVRVADASVPPIALSTHLMSSTYGVAEQASNIIRAFWNSGIPSQPAYSHTRLSTASSSNSGSGVSRASTSMHRSGSSKISSWDGSAGLLHGWISLLIVATHIALALK